MKLRFFAQWMFLLYVSEKPGNSIEIIEKFIQKKLSLVYADIQMMEFRW